MHLDLHLTSYYLYGQVFPWSWWSFHFASLLGKKEYKVIPVINSKKHIHCLVLPLLFLLSIHDIFFFPLFFLWLVYILIWVCFIRCNLFFFLVFHFSAFSCWLSTNNDLIWMFVAFLTFIEVVSLWLAYVIVDGVLRLVIARYFFLFHAH